MQHGWARFKRQSRAAVGWALGLFVAGQLVVGLLLDHAFPLTRFPTAGHAVEVAKARPEPPAVVFLGSSRTMAVVVPDEADKVLADAGLPPPQVLNAAVPAGDALSAELIYDQMVRAGRRPGWVVIEVSPETLAARPPFMSVHAVRQLTWADLVELPAILDANSGWHYLEARLVPTYTHRRQLVREMVNAGRAWLPVARPPAPAPAAGLASADSIPAGGAGDAALFAPAPADEGADVRALRVRVGAEKVVRRWLRNYRLGGPVADALDRLAARCQADGVGVILLGIPACSPHRAEVTPAIDAAYRAHMRRLVDEHGCRFIDARDWVPDAEFNDTLHVRGEGAVPFTRRFTADVLVPLLAPVPPPGQSGDPR